MEKQQEELWLQTQEGRHKRLGNGAHAAVWQVSNTKALKVLKPRNELQQEAVERELHIYTKTSATRISPTLYEHWVSRGASCLLMELFDGDMHRLGKHQFAESGIRRSAVYTQVLFTEEQLLRMFRLAQELGVKYQVIHSDLRLDQFLYHRQGKSVVVADYGFSGHYPKEDERHWKYAMVGWNIWKRCNLMITGQKLPPLAEQVPFYLEHYNQFQLLADLTANNTICYVSQGAHDISVVVPEKAYNRQFRQCGPGYMDYVSLPRSYPSYHIPSDLL